MKPVPMLSAWSQRLLSELENADGRAERLARGLTREQFNWNPRPGAWSIGQCLEHLRIGNEIYLPAISNSLEDKQPSPVQEVVLSRISRWFIHNYIGPAVGTRANAPSKARPDEVVETSVLDGFLQTNRMARELIRRASSYDVNRIRFRNPFVPLLRFTVGTGLEIIAKHEDRHLLQAEGVKQSAEFPRL